MRNAFVQHAMMLHCLQPRKQSTVLLCIFFDGFQKFYEQSEINQRQHSHSFSFFHFHSQQHSVGGVWAPCAYRLANAGIARLIYAAYKDPAGEGDVEAEVDQHVPGFATHTDRPGNMGTTSQKNVNGGEVHYC